MAVKMRLRREGKRKQPFYRVVVADARSPRDGRFIEDIGYYHPLREPSEIEIKRERALYWLGEGVQPSDAVRQLLRVTGIWEEFRPGDVGRQRPAAVEAAAKAAAAASTAAGASAAQATPATAGEAAEDDQAGDETSTDTSDVDGSTGDTSTGEAGEASGEDADEPTAEASAS